MGFNWSSSNGTTKSDLVGLWPCIKHSMVASPNGTCITCGPPSTLFLLGFPGWHSSSHVLALVQMVFLLVIKSWKPRWLEKEAFFPASNLPKMIWFNGWDVGHCSHLRSSCSWMRAGGTAMALPSLQLMTTWVVISIFMIACGAGGCKCKDKCLQSHMWPNMHAQRLHMQFHVAAKLQRQSHLKCHVAKMFDTTHYAQTCENSLFSLLLRWLTFS